MIIVEGIPVFLKDCAAFSHPQFGVTKVMIVKFFQKLTLLLAQRMAKAAGRRVVMIPLILFSDDTSGNKSKKWHKFESWSFMLAGLPRNRNAKHENIHFICCSDRVDALGMSRPIAEELTELETDGIQVYDAHLNEQVLVISPLLCINCDNPQASKLMNHLGAYAKKYCRFCMADRDTSPCLVCEKRSVEQSLQQMEVILSQITEALKEYHRKLYGIREVSNPLLYIPGDLYKGLPVEVLHTILLGCCKAFLKAIIPKLTSAQKAEVLARILAFNHSGFKVKIHGILCYHYQSFVGRDYKAWMQMAVFILYPFLSDGELQVLVNLFKVFQIAYCDFFELSKAEAWNQICADFVHSVRDFMPEMLQKQKVHYVLHLVQCMHDFGPSSSFCTERPESFNSNVRIQNIFGNKQAPSRDIAAHFSVIEHLRFVCEGGCYNDQMERSTCLYYSNEVQRFLNSTPSKELNAHKTIYTAATARMPSDVCDQFMFVKVKITELGVESTIEQLLHMDPPFRVNLHLSSLLDGKVQQFKAVMSYVLELVHTGDYIELQPPFCEFKYGQLLSTIKSETGHTSCLVQGIEALVLPDEQPLLNPFDCPLYNLSRTIFSVDSSAIYISPINLLKASLVYAANSAEVTQWHCYTCILLCSVSIRTAGRELKYDCPNKSISRDKSRMKLVRGDRCLKDYGFRLS
eukprot:Em0003g1687a